jgi:preprotein translocase subunit YajC
VFYQWLTLAQAEGDANALPRMMFLILMLGMAFYFILWLPEKRKRDESRKQLENLKENDRIVTAGGIHGTVTNVRRDQQIVTVRVDESTGTKIRLATSAIAQVLTDQKGENEAAAPTSGLAKK